MGNPVVHFEIVSPDATRLQQFYMAVFGWTIDSNNQFNYGMVDTGSTRGIPGGISAPLPGGGTGSHFAIYVEVPNVEETLKEAVACGGKIAMDKVTVPPNGPVLAQFTDPAGNRIGLVEAGTFGRP
jgi:predicted enzyme related to lactoylglutathione lyase